MGARLKIEPLRPVRKGQVQNTALRLNVRQDRHGEFFTMRLHPAVDASVIDCQPSDRHLLLHVVDTEGQNGKFLCGHDERQWFVAGVPDDARGVVNVKTAKLALQPDGIAELASHLRPKNRLRRRNAAFRRQGEWFFVPVPDLEVNPALVLRNEPLSRGAGSKLHVMQFAYRRGGQTVYVGVLHPTGITQDKYNALDDKARKDGHFRQMLRDAEVFAKGKIRHPDHATIVLSCWHRVQMNTEQRARAMARQVAFLD